MLNFVRTKTLRLAFTVISTTIAILVFAACGASTRYSSVQSQSGSGNQASHLPTAVETVYSSEPSQENLPSPGYTPPASEADSTLLPLQPKRITAASSVEEVTQAALRQAKGEYRPTLPPRIVVAQRISSSDLLKLNLGIGSGAIPSSPMVVVVLEGDFDLSSDLGYDPTSNQPYRVKYLAYVYDLQLGSPFLTATSDGQRFETLLNLSSPKP